MVARKALHLEMIVRFSPPQPRFYRKEGMLQSSTFTAVTFADFKSVIDAITAQISVSQVVGVLAAAAAHASFVSCSQVFWFK